MSTKTLLFLSLLAAAPALNAQRLIVGDSARNLYDIDLVAGAQNGIGQITSNLATLGALAYDRASGRLYAASTSNDSLFLIDQTNWRAKLVGAFGDAAIVMHGMEWDSSTGTLYGYSSHNNGSVYTIDTATGAASLIGTTGLFGFGNLAHDPTLDVMLMCNTSTDSLYVLDRVTAVPTLIGPLNGPTNPHEMAFDVDSQTLYLVCSLTDTVYTVDRVTGAATPVLALASQNYLSMVHIPGTGSLTRQAHGCGPTTVFVSGDPNLGGVVELTVENVTGFGFVGFGITPLGAPFCGCTIGHEWAVASLGPTVSLALPMSPNFVGVSVFAQGMDFLGTGGCADPMLTLTDTIEVHIGS